MKQKWSWNPNYEPVNSDDWKFVMRIVGDILLLYHEQSEYSGFMGDLRWATVYELPYWEYLNATGLMPELRTFIRNGCLVMIIAMSQDIFDGQSNYLKNNIDDCLAKVSSLKTLLFDALLEDSQTAKLIDTVCLALETIKKEEEETKELEILFKFVHDFYVKGYFLERVKSF